MNQMRNNYLWSLKYKPDNLDQLKGRIELITRLKELSRRNNVPHLLFNGPKGFGKTTTAILTAKKILGDSFISNFKIVYASDPLLSDERAYVKKKSYVSTSKIGSMAGKQFSWPAFIFSRIKPFVELKPIGEKPFKIIIIKDFHNLESEQQGFRRLMEKYARYARFFLITDEISSVIDPILSRCSIFFFNKIDFNSFKDLILEIGKREELILEKIVPKILYHASAGKIGQAISILQTASVSVKKIGPDQIYRCTSSDLVLETKMLAKHVIIGKVNRARDNFNKLNGWGYSLNEILSGMTEEILNLSINEPIKAGIMNLISDLEFNSISGNDERLQMENIIYQLLDLTQKIEKSGVIL